MVRLEKLLEEHGRDRADVSVTVCPYLKPIGADAMEQYAEAGVDRVVLPVLAFDTTRLPEQLDRANAHLERARAL
jgi:citrate lyase beta subunit